MKRILVLGAGRSSSALITYLLREAANHAWTVKVGDKSIDAARERVAGAGNAMAMTFDMDNVGQVEATLREADVVVSLLPPHYQPQLAKQCLKAGVHLFGASYLTEDVELLDEEARRKRLLFLTECGLDPGIDHMSLMRMIRNTRALGGQLSSVESFAGGLISKDTDPANPWRYKFTWNPRNVVMAGKGTSAFLFEGRRKQFTERELFTHTFGVHLPDGETLEGYVNRDSMRYLKIYGLNELQTFLRGTLRYPGFCEAWNLLVQLSCCNEDEKIDAMELTHGDFVRRYLRSAKKEIPVWKLLRDQFSLSAESHGVSCLNWSGFFEETPVGLKGVTPAQIVEHILDKKWRLRPGDHDRVVMWHRLKFTVDGKAREHVSWLDLVGANNQETAMAHTVGLPLGVAVKLFLEDRITLRGVRLPVDESIYDPVLDELEKEGIKFRSTAD